MNSWFTFTQENHENWYPTNNNESTVYFKLFSLLINIALSIKYFMVLRYWNLYYIIYLFNIEIRYSRLKRIYIMYNLCISLKSVNKNMFLLWYHHLIEMDVLPINCNKHSGVNTLYGHNWLLYIYNTKYY